MLKDSIFNQRISFLETSVVSPSKNAPSNADVEFVTSIIGLAAEQPYRKKLILKITI
jgi:hypothetical protein